MISTSDFKKGARIELDGAPWTIVSTNTQTPSARGAATLVKVRLKNVLDGRISDRTFKAGEKFKEPDVQQRAAQFLYSGMDGHVFMDLSTYDQFTMTDDDLGDDAQWLVPELEVKAVLYNDNVVGVELPQFVEMTLDRVEPGSRGDTASGGVTTAAYTTSGVRIQVPLYIREGDLVRIDTTTGTFKDRISG
ncbi:MAG: elongation factor P [Myxococcales bacterium]|nr:elongation factor P [Myxococcales bacterium]